jgi:hypothetical protein
MEFSFQRSDFSAASFQGQRNLVRLIKYDEFSSFLDESRQRQGNKGPFAAWPWFSAQGAAQNKAQPILPFSTVPPT